MGNGAVKGSKHASKCFCNKCFVDSVVIALRLVSGVRKFNQCFMLERELGSGAYSIVRLGINKVLLCDQFIFEHREVNLFV